MKKLFTLTMLSLLTLGLNAQNYRKWDFTQWSATTIANLQADAAASSTEGWSDIEKDADAGEGKVAPEATAGKCFWLKDASMTALSANGVSIAETEGLVFNGTYTGKRSLAIAVNYPSTSLGEYHGGQYLWLGGGGKNVACFTIPKVRIGQKITMTVESHKPADARGVELYVGSVEGANKIGDSFKPTLFDTYSWENWTLPDGVSGNDDGETADIIVYNTNGCHIYTLEVGDADQKSKVAYLYTGETDAALAVAQANANYEVEAIDVASSTLTAEQLQAYDVTIVAASVPADNAVVGVLKEAQPWTPIVNLNPALYAAWGYGEAVNTGSSRIQLLSEGDALFAGANIVTQNNISMINMASTSIMGVQLDGRFADDEILAGAFGRTDYAATIHTHNINHNGYIYVPFQADATDDAKTVLANAIKMAANSKTKVSAAPQPTITLSYQNMSTTVRLACGLSGSQIFYTTDGTEPTTESTPYTEPFSIAEEGVTVKAVAIAEGYTLSEAASKLVDLKQQAAAPAIAQQQADGTTTVTLTAGEGTIWYNFSQSNDTLKSTRYTGPIAYTLPREGFSAFVTADGKVNSDVATADIKIQNLKARIDVLAHMDANSTDYNAGSTSTAYYFSWVKDKGAYAFYNLDDVTTSVTTDPETGDEVETKTYNSMNPEETKDFENGWAVRSRGQLVVWENQNTGENYGDHNAYNFATVDDKSPYFPATKGIINLADKNTQPADATFPYNAYVVTTQKQKGPFDVVLNVGSIVKYNAEDGATAKHHFVVEVAADGNEWTSQWQVLGDTIKMEGMNRLTKNYTRSYDGEDEVYVRVLLTGNNSKIGLYDIYIANEGEESKKLEEAAATGIATAATAAAKARPAAIYDLNGRRLSGLQRGVNIVRYTDGKSRKMVVR